MKRLTYNTKKCEACRTCEIACAVGHSKSKQLFTAIFEEPMSLPRIKINYSNLQNMPLACRHCDNPKCVDACIASALKKDKKTGLVLYDPEKCVGCWMCVMVCPYGAVRPQYKTKLTVRCDMCPDVDTPRCVSSCPVKAIKVEDK